MHFELFQDDNEQWRCRMRFRNGRIFMTSEGYSSLPKLHKSLGAFANGLKPRAGDVKVVTEPISGHNDPATRFTVGTLRHFADQYKG